MREKYRYTMNGAAAAGQTWTTSGTLDLEPSDFFDALELAMRETFEQLTQGKAVFGQPGVGCKGPYTLIRFLLEKEGEGNTWPRPQA